MAETDDCTATEAVEMMDAGQCAEINDFLDLAVDWNLPNDLCTASLEENVAPASWASTGSLCSPNAPVDCDTGICLPPPDADGAVCIYRAGDHDCPIDPYTVRVVRYSDYDDTRGCTTCDCTAGGSVPRCELTTYSDSDCDGVLAVFSSTNSDCLPELVGVGAIGLEMDGSCGGASGGDPTGSATPTGAVTLCCAP